MDVHIGYLMSLLEDEFSQIEDIRILAVFPSAIVRSPDLPQDYDPESSDLHLKSGVRVLTKRGREYFFPKHWVTSNQSNLIHATIEEIRSEAVTE